MEEIVAVACGVQNMALSAHAYGLGSRWVSGGIPYTEVTNAFFGLGPEDKLLGFFNLDHVRAPALPGERGPVLDKVRWVAE